jgi:hypothetical protein
MLLARISCIKMQELQPLTRSHTRVTGGWIWCVWMRSLSQNKSKLIVLPSCEWHLKFLVVPFLAWLVGNYNPLLQTDRQTDRRADVGTDTELGETLGRWHSPREWIIPDVKLYHLVVLISSYNKETGTRFILSQTYTVWTQFSQILGKVKLLMKENCGFQRTEEITN